ncbi:hypothetical protein BB561_000742 [Smittium simulii]|uniref:Peptidase S8/S53 domain-containing protein n=1 Tax=Smittium simulii TaxID=133385 RepID=A0A2T9YXM9_9FUNG|nr:hypothetical protein BB561_000742 [Smittium simulii]
MKLHLIQIFMCAAVFCRNFVSAEREGGKAKIYLVPKKLSKDRSMFSQINKKTYNVVLRDTKDTYRNLDSNSKNRKIHIDSNARNSLKTVLSNHISSLNDKLGHKKSLNKRLNSTDSEIKIQSSAIIGDSFASYSASFDDVTIEKIANLNDVDFIEEDFPISAFSYRSWTPWSLTRINQDSHNNNTFPVYSTGFSYSETGKGITAYILDSGVNRNHIEFGEKSIKDSVTFLKVTPDMDDDLGHGTMVASILGGKNLGVAKDVYIKSVRVTSKLDGGVASNFASGLGWIVDDWKKSNYAPAVINMSVGALYSVSKVIDKATQGAEKAGMFISIAAGNISVDACKTSPSSSGSGLVVGAISNTKDSLSLFSNLGPCVNILAPGEELVLASNVKNKDYVIEKGTSFAAPIVGGVAALYLEKYPNATPDDIKKFILANANPSATELSQNTTNLVVSYRPNMIKL